MGKNSLIGTVGILLMIVMTAVAATPVEARLAPPGNSYDRQAVVNEAWYAMTGVPYTSGGKLYNGYWVSNFNYLASDRAALYTVATRYSWRTYAGWSPYYTYYQSPSYGYYQNLGRGGQCKFFVELVLYRSQADQRQLPTWSVMWASYSAPVTNPKLGAVLFSKNGDLYHIVIVVYKAGTTLGLIESNWVDPCYYPATQVGRGEIISYRQVSITWLQQHNYREYVRLDYYAC